MAHHAIHMTDGSIGIMQTVGDATPEECLAKWHPDNLAKVVKHQPLDPADIPTDRAFRDAWVHDGKRIVHDMATAKAIHRDRLRGLRKPILAQLDVAFQNADETNNAAAKAHVVALKQKLRDIPAHPAIELAATVDELKSLTLEALTA